MTVHYLDPDKRPCSKSSAHMSFPRAAALPVSKLDLSAFAKRRLRAHGIVSALHLAEIALSHPHMLKTLTGASGGNAKHD